MPGNLGLASAVLARMAILAPSLAQALAMANPIPLEAPDITTVFPANGFLSVWICLLNC